MFAAIFWWCQIHVPISYNRIHEGKHSSTSNADFMERFLLKSILTTDCCWVNFRKLQCPTTPAVAGHCCTFLLFFYFFNRIDYTILLLVCLFVLFYLVQHLHTVFWMTNQLFSTSCFTITQSYKNWWRIFRNIWRHFYEIFTRLFQLFKSKNRLHYFSIILV